MLLFVTPTLMTLALAKGVGLGLVAGILLSKACRCEKKAANKPMA